MSSAQQHLSQSIERVLKNWLCGESARNAQEIVSCEAKWGSPKDFISDVYDDLGRHVNLLTLGIAQARFGDLINAVPGDDFVLNKDHLRALWASGPIPPTITMDDLDAQAEALFYAFRRYEWMVLEGRHFDAETPHGADSVLQLPFFQRYLDHVQAEKIIQFQSESLPDHLMTWTGEMDNEDLPF